MTEKDREGKKGREGGMWVFATSASVNSDTGICLVGYNMKNA